MRVRAFTLLVVLGGCTVTTHEQAPASPVEANVAPAEAPPRARPCVEGNDPAPSFDARPTGKVNVQLAAGRDVAAVVARHGAQGADAIGSLPDWYSLAFADGEAAQRAVVALRCDEDVVKAELDMARRREPR